MTENGNMYMPVVPQGFGYGNGNDGMFGGNWMWFLLVWMAMFGWGNGGFGFGGNNGTYSEVQRGFDQNALVNGLGNIQNTLANNQMASMNQQFGVQTALQNCCCENRAGLADVKYTVATEACADRNAISSALRDVIEANASSTQKILDTMCQDKIDAKNETIALLRSQLQMAQLAASQGAQTSAILADNAAQTFALEQYLAPVPKPAYIVQNPNCCQQNYGTCGCGA